MAGSIERAVLYIPGTSGPGFLDDLKDIAKSRNYSLYVFDEWKDTVDLEDLRIIEILKHLSKKLEEISNLYPKTYLIGKSFGGAMALLERRPMLSGQVLWAPIGRISQADFLDTVEAQQPLKFLSSFKNLTLLEEILKNNTTKTLLIRGENDEVVSAEDLSALVTAIPYATEKTIPGMSHSPKSAEQRKSLLTYTFDFLDAQTK